MHPLNTSIFQIVTIPIPDPATAADFAYTVPANTRLELIQLRFLFTSDPNAANRLLYINVDDGTTENPIFISHVVQTNNKAWTHTFSQHTHYINSSANFSLIQNPIPTPFFLNQGDVLQSNITAKQVGDELTAISIRVKRWITEG